MKDLIITVGLPGSGKTTYLRNYLAFKDHIIISPDQIRGELTGDISDQTRNKEVWEIAYTRLIDALKSDIPNIGFDATLINTKNRSILFNKLKSAGVSVNITILFMDIPKEICLKRQKKRVRQVPSFILDSFEKDFENPTYSEFQGFPVVIRTIKEGDKLFNFERLGFVGDIQSCYDPLEQMLLKLGFWKEGDEWYSSLACVPIFLGDLVDRGPNTVDVLKTLKQLKDKNLIHIIMGNHDNKLMRFLKSLQEIGSISDGIKNRINPKKIIINHGLDLTLKHLEYCSEQELSSFVSFLQSIPKVLHFEQGNRKFVAVHAFWAPWMDKEESSKKSHDLMLYGLSDGYLENGLPKRIKWWEIEKYQQFKGTIVSGHYAEKIDLPHYKCADWGACYGNELACYLPGIYSSSEDKWITVKSNYNYKTEKQKVELGGQDTALTYNEIFEYINNPNKLIDEIEKNDQLKKTRYLIEFDTGVNEIVVANAKKNLFTPDPQSYSEQSAKGLVYNKTTSEIIGVTLFKCYNFKENKSADKSVLELLQKNNLIIQCNEKLDGTQIYRIVYKNKVFWGTRSLLISEYNEIGEDNTDFFKLIKDVPEFNKLNDPSYESNKTLIFELLHPENRTVVPYTGVPQLRCLGFSLKEENKWVGQFSSECVPLGLGPAETLLKTKNLQEADNLLQELNQKNQMTEGFVANIVDNNGLVNFRIKFKTALFFETMRLLSYCTYSRTVELCLNHNLKTLESFVSYLKQDKELFPEELLDQYISFYKEYQLYLQKCNEYNLLLKEFYNQKIIPNNFSTRKDLALFVQDFPFKGYLFNIADNKLIDFDKIFQFDISEVNKKINELRDFICEG